MGWTDKNCVSFFLRLQMPFIFFLNKTLNNTCSAALQKRSWLKLVWFLRLIEVCRIASGVAALSQVLHYIYDNNEKAPVIINLTNQTIIKLNKLRVNTYNFASSLWCAASNTFLFFRLNNKWWCPFLPPSIAASSRSASHARWVYVRCWVGMMRDLCSWCVVCADGI